MTRERSIGSAQPGYDARAAAPVAVPYLSQDNVTVHPDAIGWAPQPVVDTSSFGRGRGRNKRWEYWNVVTPTHILALTVSHIDYACVHEVWVYDRATGKELGTNATVIPPRGAVLAPRLERGSSRARAKDLEIDIDEVIQTGEEAGKATHPRGTRLRAAIPGASFDVFAELPNGHERLALVVPWSKRRFQYTVKDVARPASGVLVLDDPDGTGRTEIEIPAGESWAVLDHGRGRWPYDIAWNWGAGSGISHGRTIGLQVGARWTAGTGVSENAFVVDGELHKIHGETTWRYDPERPENEWHIFGGGLDATLTPFHVKRSRTNLGIIAARTDQSFGEWRGSFTTEAGEVIAFEGIVGWAEDVHNRW